MSFKDFFLLFLRQWLSLLIARLSIFFMDFTNVLFISNLNQEQYIEALFRSQHFHGILISGFQGFAYALNVLSAQARGIGNKALVGSWLKITIIVVFVCCILVTLLHLLTDKFVLAVTSNDIIVAEYAQSYNNIFVLTLFPSYLYYCIRTVVQHSQYVIAYALIAAIACFINIGFDFLFIPYNSLIHIGFIGAAVSSIIAILFQLCSFVGYVVIYKKALTEYVDSWNLKNLTKDLLVKYLKVAVPLTLSIWIESASDYVTPFFFDNDLGYYTIFMYIMSISSFYMIPYITICVVGNNVIGYEIGKGDKGGCKQNIKIIILLVFFIWLITSVTVFFCNDMIAKMLTQDERNQQLIRDNLWVLSIDSLAFGFYFICVTILEATADFNLTIMIVNTLSLLFVKLPLSILMKKHILEIQNQIITSCLNTSITTIVSALVYLYIIYNMKWTDIFSNARAKMIDSSPS